MMPILKKGKNESKASNDSPISLTSSCCKLLERIKNNVMHMYLESENIIGHEQAGFRQYKSTEDQTTHLSQVVEDAFQSKKVTLVVFVDLQMSFDKINFTIYHHPDPSSAKDKQCSNIKKTLTMSMLEEEYPTETWVRVYTDGSATNATSKGEAVIYIKYPNENQQSETILTGLHRSNYKAEEEALTRASHSIKNKIDNTTQVVFLTDALSVLQALKNEKLHQLQQALYNIKSLTTVIQWIHSHCGVWGNEQADKLAKYGAEQQQEENPVCFTEMKTIIKSLFNTPQQQDSYHQLTRSEQTTIFRLRTGHNRPNQRLHKVMKVVPSPMCPCGEAGQDTAHLL
ncbi:unnamed protein product [Mytilus edulis]|uniref:RNase H type-1 domain-containing protein n=1 Tax=Mytilus edulis TaxID=6550 RepID=A0A8S3VPY1_MYTED|nr:unnamed protein product [Mytilus edulis]